MSFWGRLFGTDKAIDNIVDKDNGLIAKAGGYIDRLSFTDEEKAEHRLKVQQWGLKQLEALAPFKVVQRILAFNISLIWSVVAINVLVAVWVGDEQIKADLLEFAFSDYVFWPVTVCFGLYFGGGLIESIRKAK